MAQAIDRMKFNELANLKVGTKVLLTNGDIAVFSRLKQKNFEGTINNSNFNIPVNMFVEVLEVPEANENYKDLKLGELFYINIDGKYAAMYSFVGIENKRIVGINPITKSKTRIDTSLYMGKVSDAAI